MALRPAETRAPWPLFPRPGLCQASAPGSPDPASGWGRSGGQRSITSSAQPRRAARGGRLGPRPERRHAWRPGEGTLGPVFSGPRKAANKPLRSQAPSAVAVLPGGTNSAEPSSRSRRGLGARGRGLGAEGGAPAEGRLWEASWGLLLTVGETSGSPPPSFPAPRCLSHAHTMQTCVPTLVCTPRTEPLPGSLHSHVQAHRCTRTLHAHARTHAQAPVLTRPLSAGSIWSAA